MEKSILPAAWDVPQIFRNRLGDQVGRQRPMAADGHLLLVLHAPPKPEQNDRAGRFFWRSPDGKWTSKDLGTGLNAVNKHLDDYNSIIARLDKEEDEATSADDYFALLDHLAPLLRAARNMHNVLQEARQMCPEIREIINLRDRAYEIQRTAELLYEGAKDTLDVIVAKRAEEQTRASHRMEVSAYRLNILAAFFFPIATLTAIFGVNMRHGLEDWPSPLPFFCVITIGLILGAALSVFITRPPSDSI